MKGSKKGFYDSLKVGLSEEEQAKKAEEVKKKIALHKYKNSTQNTTNMDEYQENTLSNYLYMIVKRIGNIPMGLQKDDLQKYGICPKEFDNIQIGEDEFTKFEQNWKRLVSEKYNELIRQDDD